MVNYYCRDPEEHQVFDSQTGSVHWQVQSECQFWDGKWSLGAQDFTPSSGVLGSHRYSCIREFGPRLSDLF